MFEEKLKNLVIALLAGMVLIIDTACDREHERQARVVTSLRTAANAWLTNNGLAGKAACEISFWNGDPQLDVVGIVTTDQQDPFSAMITANSIRASRIRFWTEKPAFDFLEIVAPEVSSAPRQKLEAEAKDKLLRTVSLSK